MPGRAWRAQISVERRLVAQSAQSECPSPAFFVVRSHELLGRIALAEKDYGRAKAELEQANQQDPSNLFRLSLACRGKGDNDQARDLAKRAADFNSLPQLNYAFVRSKAQKAAGAEAVAGSGS